MLRQIARRIGTACLAHNEAPAIFQAESGFVAAQTVVDQCKRDNLPLSASTVDRMVLDTERAFLIDYPGHARKHIQIQMREQ